MFRVTGTDGRKIAAYKFGNPADVRSTQLSGRTAFSVNLKKALIEQFGARCNIYLEPFPVRELQIDHRVPFEIMGDNELPADDLSQYMLLSPSANRARSWSCEHCPNWQRKSIVVCRSCYWAFPESYQHIATRDIRRLDLLWCEEEVGDYDLLAKEAERVKEEIPEYVKSVLRLHFQQRRQED